jgi:hypothetical protein
VGIREEISRDEMFDARENKITVIEVVAQRVAIINVKASYRSGYQREATRRKCSYRMTLAQERLQWLELVFNGFEFPDWTFNNASYFVRLR